MPLDPKPLPDVAVAGAGADDGAAPTLGDDECEGDALSIEAGALGVGDAVGDVVEEVVEVAVADTVVDTVAVGEADGVPDGETVGEKVGGGVGSTDGDCVGVSGFDGDDVSVVVLDMLGLGDSLGVGEGVVLAVSVSVLVEL